ncbi:unnamed protein product, partial [marine sediment metagenome]
NVKSYPWNTPEEIQNLRNRLKEIKNGINAGKSVFINKESHIN